MKQTAIQIVKTLQDAGHQAVFAGGCVRDQLLGVEPKDIDISTSATPDQIEALFDKTVPIGKAFGVIRVLMNGFEFEVTTFREDATTGDGRRPDSVIFSNMQADAMRRDLTINGMFWDPITDTLYDFVDGKKDLQAKRIRFIGNPNERIGEDALRILRAIRFAAMLDTTLTGENALAISNNAWRIQMLSGERIFDEMTKILRLHKPQLALTMLSELGILEKILPEVQACTQCLQGPPFHCEGNVFKHTIRVLEALPSDASDELLWGALLHDIGKPKTSAPSKTHPGSFSFYGHENVGAEMTITIFKDRFRASSNSTFTVSELVRNHMKLHTLCNMRMSTVRRLLAEPFIEDLMKLSVADENGSILDPTAHIELAFPKWQKRIAEIRADFAARGTPLIPGCLVTGKDLIDAGFKPSSNFKAVLNKIHDDQLNGVFESREAALKKAIYMMKSLQSQQQ